MLESVKTSHWPIFTPLRLLGLFDAYIDMQWTPRTANVVLHADPGGWTGHYGEPQTWVPFSCGDRIMGPVGAPIV